MDDIYTYLVRGPSSRFPRGYVWLIPVWFAVLAGVVLLIGRKLSGQLPLWFAATEVGGIVLAGLTLLCVLLTLRRHAFRANSNGIWLGIRTTLKRPKLRQVHIAWADVAQLRLARRHYGTMLEISLGPAARIVHRPGAVKQGLLLLGSLVMPVGFARGRPGLTAPRADPPRYLVKICDVTPEELAHVLAGLKPAELTMRVAAKPGASRFRPPPKQRPAPQPTGAAMRS